MICDILKPLARLRFGLVKTKRFTRLRFGLVKTKRFTRSFIEPMRSDLNHDERGGSIVLKEPKRQTWVDRVRP